MPPGCHYLKFLLVLIASQQTRALECYKCLVDESSLMGIMEVLVSGDVNAIADLTMQTPDDCPLAVTGLATCTAQDYCVKIVGSGSANLTVTFEGETLLQESFQQSDFNPMRSCNRAYAPDSVAQIKAGECYDFKKRVAGNAGFFEIQGKACYCNDKDYCNVAWRSVLSLIVLLICAVSVFTNFV